ncbi:MAG: general secretion pathway protein GspK [Alphaproteobacteria bacterium]|nr:general secretion pathway protein GspK [Alphaproteobacteria bacterium]
MPPRRAESRGFVLIVVLWALVLIAFVAGHLAAAGRSETQVAINLMANAAAEAAADGGINEAVFRATGTGDDAWALDGGSHRVTIGGAHVIVRLDDDSGRIDPNLAPPALVEALLEVVGSDPDTAQRLAGAIADWVGTATVFRPASDLADEYRAAGLDYAPPGRAVETIGELGRVLGMTPALLAALRPHLTVYGDTVPDAAHADAAVTAALVQFARNPAAPLQGQPQTIPYKQRRRGRIAATAYGPGKALLTRSAVVLLGQGLPRGFVVLAWGDGAD